MSDLTECKKGHTYNVFVNPDHCPKCAVRGCDQ